LCLLSSNLLATETGEKEIAKTSKSHVLAIGMNVLGADDKYQPGPMVQKFLEHARKLNVKVMLFVTLNNTHPWAGGKPFRQDRPDWLIDAGASRPANAPAWRQSGKGNCIGVRDFREWLDRIYLEAIAGGPYQGWEMDGDFFGGMGTVGLLVPADCQSGKHDHLPGNSGYASQKALTQSMAGIPTKTGLPDADKAEIRKWLDWGRKISTAPFPPRFSPLQMIGCG
jgi:hypothetical protein